MNVIAGILIGIVNDTWFARVLACFIWGAVFLVYTSILRQDAKVAFISHTKERGKPLKWGLPPTLWFYVIEYFTATFTSLPFALMAGFIRCWF
jgi:hypothetical protein